MVGQLGLMYGDVGFFLKKDWKIERKRTSTQRNGNVRIDKDGICRRD